MKKKTLRVYLVLKYKNSELYEFVLEFIRRYEKKDSFIIGWINGNRIYIDDGNAKKREVFACLAPEHLIDNKNAVSIINYAIPHDCTVDIHITENELVFLISSDDEKKIKFIETFKNGLFHPDQN